MITQYNNSYTDFYFEARTVYLSHSIKKTKNEKVFVD